MGFQNITIQGNITRDATVRPVGDRFVSQFGVAVSERYTKADGTKAEVTEFFDCEYWTKNQNFAVYLTKGSPVLVSGKMRTERWQDNEGQARETRKIRADVVQLCGGKPQQQPQQPAFTPNPQPRYNAVPQTPPAPQTPPVPPTPPVSQPQSPQAFNPASHPDDLPF